MANTHQSDISELTPTQRRVLELVAEGLSNREIAGRLGISRNAVRFHLKNIHASLETDGKRSALASHGPPRFRVLVFSAPWLAGIRSAALVAALMTGGFLAVRAAHQWSPKAEDVQKDAHGSRLENYCYGKMGAGSPGNIELELCFATLDDAASYSGD